MIEASCCAVASARAHDGADVVLRGALGEQLEKYEIVVAVGDDAGKIVGLRKNEAVRIIRFSDGSELIAESECGFDAGTQVGQILLTG